MQYIAPTIKINRLIMKPTGTFRDMFCRPYVTDFRNHQTISNIQDRISNVGISCITPDTFKGTSSQGYVIAPSAGHTGNVLIPNGWATERLSFVLEVEVANNLSSSKVFFFQGYTDMYDPSMTGAIDEKNTIFYINSYVAVMRITVQGYFQDIVTENVNIANGTMLTNSLGPDAHIMRGMDVMHGMQGALLSQTYGQSVVDTRSVASRFVDSKAVSRSESHPLKYLSNIFNAYAYAENHVGIGRSNEDKIATAVNQLNYDTVVQNEFISYLSRQYGRPRTTHFRLTDLIALDPTCMTRAVKGEKSQAARTVLPSVEMSESWNRSDMLVQAATMFTNAFTSIMLELLITKITISCDNTSVIGNPIIVNIVDKGMSLSSADLTKHYQMLQMRTASEILYEMSFGNKIPFKIYGSFDIFNESRFQISVGDEPMTPFVVPSFANSLTLPTVANSGAIYHQLVNDFDTALNTVTSPVNQNDYFNISNGI